MEKTLSDYISLSKNIDDLKFDKKIKVAILSSFTLNGLNETLHVMCSELGIRYQSFVAGYNQYNQELLNPKSDYHKFCPDVTFLIMDIRNFLGENFHFPYNISDEERKSLVEEKINHLENIIRYFEKKNRKISYTTLEKKIIDILKKILIFSIFDTENV